MNSELYVENLRADLTADLSTLLTFAIDDLREFDKRTTKFSKTIVLPGTANNNKLFGHIFEISQANFYDPDKPNVGYNFNASKSANVILFQDNIQAMKGVLRLLQINIIKGQIEYEVAVFGELALLNVALSSGLLEDLDFSEYDLPWTASQIIASWDIPGGAGVFFPSIDYGQASTNKHDWDIRTIRPALFVKQYIDKMFASAKFRYESPYFNTTRFKRQLVPHNQQKLTRLGTDILRLEITSLTVVGRPGFLRITAPIHWQVFSGTLFTTPDNVGFTYAGTVATSAKVSFALFGTVKSNITVNGQPNNYLFQLVRTRSGTDTVLHQQQGPTGDNFVAFIWAQSNIIFDLEPGDSFYWGVGASETRISTAGANMATDGIVNIPLAPGDTIQINSTIPRNVRQIDFLTSIIKHSNLYVYEDRFDNRLIHITPWIDFYTTNSSDADDWSDKLNRDKPVKIKPMSELNAKLYKFQFKPDTDYYNDLYKKRYGEGYGDFTFNSQYEFAEQEQTLPLIFSATPLVGYQGEDKVYSTIVKSIATTAADETQTDSNIRILLSKKINGVTEWKIKDGSVVLANAVSYGYAGHLDDPDLPDNDLNFGALQELFFSLSTGNLTKTQFNVFYSAYMAEITDKDSKLFTGKFYLTTEDIAKLDFSKKKYIDGTLYRLKKITDYNASTPDECEAELLKVNYLTY